MIEKFSQCDPVMKFQSVDDVTTNIQGSTQYIRGNTGFISSYYIFTPGSSDKNKGEGVWTPT